MPWSELSGHDAAIASLRRALASGRLPNGLLLHGPAGTGKHAAARLFAQALACTSLSRGDAGRAAGPSRAAEETEPSLFATEPATEGESPEGGLDPSDPCGTCLSCRRIEAGLHPDVREMGLEPSPSTGKMRQEIVVDQIRALTDFLSLRPHEAPRRVAIVDPADRMNPFAGNAFLKTLEEPAAGAILLLVARNRHALLPTIRSRCRPVAFGTLPPALIESILHRRGVGERDAALAACLADGAPGRAIALAASVEASSEDDAAPGARSAPPGAAAAGGSALDAFRERRDRVLAALELAAGVGARSGARSAEALRRGRGTRALRAAENFAPKDNEEFTASFDLAERLLRDALVLATEGAQPVAPAVPVAAAASADDPARLAPLAAALGVDRAASAVARAARLRGEIRSYANKQLAIECLLAELGA